MLTVPRTARVACWLNAWLSRREGADHTITGVIGSDGEVEFSAVGPGTRLSAALLLGELRRLGVRRVSAALPHPGHPLGLGGPAAFNADALDAGEALLLYDVGVGLVPHSMNGHTVWMGAPADPPGYLPDVPTADRELRAELVAAADALAELDVASWSPDVADLLMNLRSPMSLDPQLPFASGPAGLLMVAGLRGREIVELALRAEGGATSASEAAIRRELLSPLRRAADTAVVAAASATGAA
jgi:hypothetical protein